MTKTITIGPMFAVLAAWAAASTDVPADQASITKLGDVVEFKCNGKLVTRYHTRKIYAKPYFWPLNAPGEISLTRDWPMKPATPGDSIDHPHQRSAWFGHGDVIPEDIALASRSFGVKGVDFWSEGLNHGKIECVGIDLADAAKGVIRTRNAWKTSEVRTILNEIRDITLMTLENAHLLIIRIELSCTGAVTFGDTKEGTLGVRLHDWLRLTGNTKSAILNANGSRGEKECWGRKADWCDYSGEIDGKPCGVTIFDDTENRHRACWHVRGYGLLSANPFGRAESGFPAQKDLPEPPVKLKPGEVLQLRYGILLHAGDCDIQECYRRFLAR